jgi:hypothetical protein
MNELKEMKIKCFEGKNPTCVAEEPILNDEGLLVATGKRKESPNEVLLKLISHLSKKGMKFETVKPGLKFGNEQERSICVAYNVNDTAFSLYVLKRHPEALPKIEFTTSGKPIAGSNSKSSRVTIPYENNDYKAISAFVLSLPGEFENGRVTHLNDAVKVEKAEKKPKAKKVKVEKAEKKPKAKKVKKSKGEEIAEMNTELDASVDTSVDAPTVATPPIEQTPVQDDQKPLKTTKKVATDIVRKPRAKATETNVEAPAKPTKPANIEGELVEKFTITARRKKSETVAA